MSSCADHVYGPEGYAERAEWGERMVETHIQSACDECHLYLIWTPKALDNGHAETPENAALNGSDGGQA